jgi:subtilase family serine protease
MIKSNRLRVGAGFLGAWLCVVFTSSNFAADSTARHFIHGQIPAAVARLRAGAELPATNQLQLSIALPLRNEAGLDALLKQIQDPASANYHQYLTPEQFAENFGPTKADYQALIDFAEKNNLKVTRTHPNRVILDVTGSVADIEKTFQVKIHSYQHPTEPRMFYAPDTDPSVDASLPVSILSISGLDNYSLPHPASLRMSPTNQPPGATPDTGSGPGGTYQGNDFRFAYAPGTTLTGAGQSVALLQFDGYYSNDITAYETAAGLSAVSLTNVPVNGGVSTPGSGAIEVSLDIEMAISMAPGLAKVIVYEAPGGTAWTTILSQIANDNLAKQISCSWGGGSVNPNAAAEIIFKQMASQGQAFFCAAGDDDAYVGGTVFPDDSPNVIEVGGTLLTTVTRTGARSSEIAWNRNNGTGTGGGVSTYYAIPTWQLGISSFATNGGSTVARNVPDVALTAENVFVRYGNGQSTTVGGTSCASPLWAGFLALVNQSAVTNGKPVVGFINPAVYEIANESIYSSAFNDITAGSNTWTSSPNAFFAVSNYDLCTGVGTPKGTSLINALASPDPLIVVSNVGFKAVGTPAETFNIASQTFFLTNAGTASLSWSLISTSAWLTVSNSSGTLAAGGNNAVVVSLNTVASNLLAGTYSATVWFSNVTSHVGHARYFTLTTSDPLVILPSNKFTFSGPPGGPFTPASQGIILTNLSASTFNWNVNNTSVWFSVSPPSGSLAPGAQPVVTFTPTPAMANLSDGIYNVSFQVTNLNTHYAQQVTAILSIGLLQNGGFETGDFTDWVLVGNTNDGSNIYNAVVSAGSLNDGSGPNFIHSGTYGAFLGDTNFATLSQTIPTVAGQNYLLSFWFDNPETGSGQLFLVNWNTNSASTNQIYYISSPPVMAWTNFTFVLTATDTNTTVQFGAENPPDGFGLDDVSVIALTPPIFTSQPTNLTISPGASAAFSASVRGPAPFSYQWLKSGTNVANGGNISGATNSTLTILAAGFTNSGNYMLFVTNNYGSATSSVATLTIFVPPGIGGFSANLDGSFTLNLLGTPGYTYILQGTTNLIAPAGWRPVATNTLDGSGVWLFTDFSATNLPQQFYRLKAGP